MQQNEAKLTGSESEKSNLWQDKIHTAGLLHVVRQINPLADPGVTFRCGCQDVSASVQQPPVVAVIGWSQGDEREEGEKGNENKVMCQKSGRPKSLAGDSHYQFHHHPRLGPFQSLTSHVPRILGHTITAQNTWIGTFPVSPICCLSDLNLRFKI